MVTAACDRVHASFFQEHRLCRLDGRPSPPAMRTRQLSTAPVGSGRPVHENGAEEENRAQTSCYRVREVSPKVRGTLPFGGHSEYASGEERILVRGWLHLLGGIGILGLLFYNWAWVRSLPAPLQLLLITDSLKGFASGTLHVVVPPHAPLVVLFAVHFVDIVVIVVSMMVSAMAFMAPSTWGPQIALGAVGSVIVGLCEVPLWHLKLMRPPGPEHYSVRVRYATMLLLALQAQYVIWDALQPAHGGGASPTSYWIQFFLYVFGFYSTATRPVRSWHRKGFYEAHDDLHTASVVADGLLLFMAFAHWGHTLL